MVACTRGVTTGATVEAEAHADVGEAVVGEEAATTTTMHEPGKDRQIDYDGLIEAPMSTTLYFFACGTPYKVSRPPFMFDTRLSTSA